MNASDLDYLTVALDVRREVLDDVMSFLIADVEKKLSLDRIEFNDVKEQYHRSPSGRIVGYTKRQTEDKLLKLTGQILGLENALSTLYQVKARTENNND